MPTASLGRTTEQIQSPETPLQREDRLIDEALAALLKKGQLTEVEKDEKSCLLHEVMIREAFAQGGMANAHADFDRRDLIERVQRELRDEFGNETASKKLLIERLTASYSTAISYERLFRTLKYTFNEKREFEYIGFMHHTMKEIRLGIKTANEEMIRFTQALYDIKRPPPTVKAQNAFFAQNQQVNQGGAPTKDLEHDSFALAQDAQHS